LAQTEKGLIPGPTLDANHEDLFGGRGTGLRTVPEIGEGDCRNPTKLEKNDIV